MKERIKAYARSRGLSLFGVAPPERFAGLPENVNPAAILPEVRSIIVFGAPIMRGDYRGVEEGTLWSFASKYVGQRLVLELARFIEQEAGYEAVPYLAHFPRHAPRSRPVAGRPDHNGMLSLEYAAVEAGLAEISILGQLLTPEYGNRTALDLI